MLQATEFKTIIDVVTRFPTEKSCHEYLASRRWSDGLMICPHADCGNETCYTYKDGIRYKCKRCKRIYTAKTGTFMEASKLPTIKWFIALYLVLHKKGISSIQLSKDIGVQQKTAWFILQRIRAAMGNEERQPLEGTVEIDETFVGGKNKNRHYSKRVQYKEITGRAYPDKAPVFGMYDRTTRKVRATAITKGQLKNIARIITRNIWPGSTLMTDDWNGYVGIDKMYDRHFIAHSKWVYADGDITTNRIENFWSHLKRGLHGTYIHVTPKHLDRYVQEFTYRFNNRDANVQQQIECVIAQMECRLKYKDLVA
jgi:transposase-like protein